MTDPRVSEETLLTLANPQSGVRASHEETRSLASELLAARAELKRLRGQEPVAWLFTVRETKPTVSAKEFAAIDYTEQEGETIIKKEPLYAAPPQAQEDAFRALLSQLDAEPMAVHEPAISVQIGRQQVADEIRAILQEQPR